MTLASYLNILVVVLLAPTLIYAVILNRRLSSLRSHRAELEAMIVAFNDSCQRAEAGVRTLRTAAEEAIRLQQYLERSQSIREDLSYLLDRGSNLADRLEGGVRTARHENKSRPINPGPAPTPSLSGDAAGGEDEAAQRPASRPPVRLMDRLNERERGGAEPGEDLAAARSADPSSEGGERSRPGRADRAERAAERAERAGGRSSLRAALAAASGGSAAPSGEGGDAPRSKAERELLQALRSRR